VIKHLLVEIPRLVGHALRQVEDFHVLPPLSLPAHFPQPVFDAVAKSAFSTSQNTQGHIHMRIYSRTHAHHRTDTDNSRDWTSSQTRSKKSSPVSTTNFIAKSRLIVLPLAIKRVMCPDFG